MLKGKNKKKDFQSKTCPQRVFSLKISIILTVFLHLIVYVLQGAQEIIQQVQSLSVSKYISSNFKKSILNGI